MVIDHAFYMQLALNEAWKYQGLTYPNPAVGSLLLDGFGQIIAVESHKRAGEPHAEVNTLKAAFLALSADAVLKKTLASLTASSDIHDFLTKNHSGLFAQCTLYVTLEPCAHHGRTPPCSLLIKELGIKHVVIGSLDPNETAAGGKSLLEAAGVQVESGILKAACDQLIEPFIKWQEKNFVFFKHAQTLNGTIDGGYISAPETLDLVHALRDRIDLIVIGGETVRSDKPTLDARRIDGKAPDVLIYSRSKTFDKTIPLFDVPGRTVHIAETLDLVESYRFVMIEGGGRMYDAVKHRIDWHLTLLSPIIRSGLSFNGTKTEKTLHSLKMGEDLLIWSK